MTIRSWCRFLRQVQATKQWQWSPKLHVIHFYSAISPSAPGSVISAMAHAVGLLVLAVGCSAVRPNVIWIMADDLGWGEVGFLDAVWAHGGRFSGPSFWWTSIEPFLFLEWFSCNPLHLHFLADLRLSWRTGSRSQVPPTNFHRALVPGRATGAPEDSIRPSRPMVGSPHPTWIASVGRASSFDRPGGRRRRSLVVFGKSWDMTGYNGIWYNGI